MDHGKLLLKLFDTSVRTEADFINKVRNELGYTVTDISENELKDIWSKTQTAIDNKVGRNYGGPTYNNRASSFSSFLTQVVQSQQTQRPLGDYDTRDLTTLIDFVSPQTGNFDFEKLKNEYGNKTGALFQSEILRNLKIEADLRRTINEDIGLSGELSADLRRDIRLGTADVMLFGYGVKDVTDMVSTIMTDSGRFNLITRETIESAGPVARAFVGTLGDMGRLMTQFQNIGIGFDNTIDLLENVGVRSTALGLRAKTTVTDIRDSMGRINEYGFKDGIEGLAEMSRRSREFRMNMQDVFTVADRVFSPEGAIELVSNLQVLGGAVGAFNNPLELMYMATNNVEGLQDALLDAASSLATYNEEQGRFEVTGVNLRVAREMANALGIQYGDLTRTAIASAERLDATNALMMTGLDFDEDEMRFLTNLSRMEGGEIKISVPSNIAQELGIGTKIALSEMSEELKNRLIEQQQAFEGMDATDFAKAQVTHLDLLNKQVSQIIEYLAVGTVNMTKNIGENLGFNNFSSGAVDTMSGYVKTTRGFADTMSNYDLSSIFPTANTGNFVDNFKTMSPVTDADKMRMSLQPQQQTTTTNTNELKTENRNLNIKITSETSADMVRRYIMTDRYRGYLDNNIQDLFQ